MKDQQMMYQILHNLFNDIYIGDQGPSISSAKLKDYTLANIQHNLLMVQRTDNTSIEKRINGEKFTSQIKSLSEYDEGGLKKPAIYDKEMENIIEAVNSFKLINNSDRTNQNYSTNALKKKVSYEERQLLMYESTKKANDNSIRNKILKIFDKSHQIAYNHLMSRAIRSDHLVENILRCYNNIDGIINKKKYI